MPAAPSDIAFPPDSYFGALDALRSVRAEDGLAWIGEVGFHLPRSIGWQRSDWVDRLVRLRWPCMQPDLLPFARDSFGNLFCFYRSGRADASHSTAIVYWMYETFSGIPISTSFPRFLDWIAITTMAAVRRGVDPVVNRDHWEGVAEPFLRSLEVRVDIATRSNAGSDVISLHRAVLAIDPDAPGSLVMRALAEASLVSDPRVTTPMERAATVFPEFTAAWLAIASIHEALRDERGTIDALLRALTLPLAYGGDPGMPWYGDLPRSDPSRVVELLATYPGLRETSIGEPVWNLVLHDDPVSAASWLRIAVEYANDGALDTAATMATNALFYGSSGQVGEDALTLLAELYEALEWSWHARIVAVDRERRAAHRQRTRSARA